MYAKTWSFNFFQEYSMNRPRLQSTAWWESSRSMLGRISIVENGTFNVLRDDLEAFNFFPVSHIPPGFV